MTSGHCQNLTQHKRAGLAPQRTGISYTTKRKGIPMKLDENEWRALAAALWGAIIGTMLSVLFFLFVGV